MLAPGMIVEFGRERGEKTRARIITVNRKSVTVETIEERGTRKSYPVGTRWRVSPALIKIV